MKKMILVLLLITPTLFSCDAAQSDAKKTKPDIPTVDMQLLDKSEPIAETAGDALDARTQASSAKAIVSKNPNSLADFALFKDCETCPEMIIIPSGSFVMGSPKDEIGHVHDEEPQIEVSVPRFALARFETTWDDWEICVKAGACSADNDDQGWGKGLRPVSTIDLQDTQSYISFLNDKTSRAYRLPTESEWEYSARSGTKTPFSFGETLSTDQANFDGNGVYGSGVKGIYRQKTVDAGSFPANPFGLFDMNGNVWEWVQDCYVNTLASTPIDGSAHLVEDCSRLVVRGGSYDNYPRAARSSLRHYMGPEVQEIDLGFRVARTLN